LVWPVPLYAVGCDEVEMEGAASKLSSQPVAAARTTAPARAMDPGRSHARARRTASTGVLTDAGLPAPGELRSVSCPMRARGL